MAGSQHFSPGDIQFQLVFDRGQCAASSYTKFRLQLKMADLTESLCRQNKFYETLELFTKKKTGAMRTTSVGGKKF